MTCQTDILNGIQLGLTLDRYQEIMRLAPAAFYGLNKPDEAGCYDCAAIWKQLDRDGMALAISQAEEMREIELHYHVAPKYLLEEQRFNRSVRYFLDRYLLIKVGTYKSADVSLGAAITLSALGVINEPVVLTVATTVTDPSEICVYHPGTDVVINPSKVTISGGNATICIPRPRLKLLTIDGNCEPFPDYDEDANFETTVDVKRCYIDETDGIDIVWHHICCGSTFTEAVQTAHGEVRNYRLSTIDVIPASNSGGIWTRQCLTYGCIPDHLLVPYLSGMRNSIYTEMITAHLANSLLVDIVPNLVDLCDCWKADQVVEDGADWTPYGISNGAVKAWLADSRAKVGQGGKF